MIISFYLMFKLTHIASPLHERDRKARNCRTLHSVQRVKRYQLVVKWLPCLPTKTTFELISNISRQKQHLRVLTNCLIMSKISFSFFNYWEISQYPPKLASKWSWWWKQLGHITKLRNWLVWHQFHWIKLIWSH